MSLVLDADVLRDHVATSMARAVAIANRRAAELGIDLQDRLVTVSQLPTADRVVWEVNYVPKQYVGRRGGDFSIEVDSVDGSIRQELHGQ